ncbi:hypothetical protein U1Q18_018789 [Sarracenia purpurea var. burkii]
MDKQEGDQPECSVVSSSQEKNSSKVEDNLQISIPDDCLSENHVGQGNDSGSDGTDAQTSRPLSPETLALMCDEQDAMPMTSGSSNAAANCNGNMTNKSSQAKIFTELYAEQERIILTKFWNFLSRIITCGSIKGEDLCHSLRQFDLLLLCIMKTILSSLFY